MDGWNGRDWVGGFDDARSMIRPWPGAEGSDELCSFLTVGGERPLVWDGRWTEPTDDSGAEFDVWEGWTGLIKPGTTPPIFELCELSFELGWFNILRKSRSAFSRVGIW